MANPIDSSNRDLPQGSTSQSSLDPSPQVVIRIPFPSARHATIVYNSLIVDPEPPRSQVHRVLSLESDANASILLATFTSSAEAIAPSKKAELHAKAKGDGERIDLRLKALKVSLNAFFEQCELVTKTVHTFDSHSQLDS